MRGKKRQKRGVWKGILTVCMIALLTAGAALSPQEKVRAMEAPSADCINILALYDQNGEMIGTTPAIGMQGSPYVVISAYIGNVSFSYAQFVTGSGKYDLEYTGGNEAMGLSLWSVAGDAKGDSGFLIQAYAYEGENVAAVYYGRADGEVTALYWEMTLTGWKENQLIADNYPSGDGIMYPASIVDQNGQLVGVLLAEGFAWDPFGSEEIFYGSGGSGGGGGSDNPGGSGGSGGGGGSDNPGGSGGSGGSRDTAPALRGIFSSDNEDDDEEEKEEEGSGLLVPILIGSLVVVAAAAVVVVVVVGRKNKQPAAVPAGASPDFGTPVQGVYPQGGASPQGGTGQLWLVARGGRMDGRVYPVDNQGITIGRDASSTICYPADTPGVSRVHARLYQEGARLMLMDCSSSAGTFLNRIGRLEPMRPVEVYAGDVFYVGEASNSFEIKS